MKNNNTDADIDLSESKFSEFMQKGDDFYKIELLRQAMTWYRKAFNINNNNAIVKFRISECERQLKYENKIVYLLISIASVIIITYFALSKIS